MVLPDGVVLSCIDWAAARRTMTGYLAGSVSLEHCRGRAHRDLWKQAGEWAARRHLA